MKKTPSAASVPEQELANATWVGMSEFRKQSPQWFAKAEAGTVIVLHAKAAVKAVLTRYDSARWGSADESITRQQLVRESDTQFEKVMVRGRVLHVLQDARHTASGNGAVLLRCELKEVPGHERPSPDEARARTRQRMREKRGIVRSSAHEAALNAAHAERLKARKAQ